MRICYLHVDYEEWTDGHYNVQEIGLAKAFAELGHEVTIVYWVKSSVAKCGTEVSVAEKIRKVYLPGLPVKHHIVFNCDLLKKYEFDLIHIQSDNLFYVPEVVRWCRRNRIAHYCYVGTIDSTNPNKLQRLGIDFITRRNLRTFARSQTFVKTPAMQAQLASLGVKNAQVAPVGLDFSIIPEVTGSREILREKLGLDKDKRVVVCVCALRASKRPLDIFELAGQLDRNTQIVFIGRGEMLEQFQAKLAEEYPCQILHVPYVDNKDIHAYYRCADFFVNFNTEEIFGMAILEAMYQGCTVVARHAPGPDYIIEHGKSGYLAESLEEMARFVKEAAPLPEAARERVMNDFSWLHTAQIALTVKGEEK